MQLALYRKWRSKTFDDVIGQEHITTTLQNEIANNKTAHSYLFTGTRGTGKTTCSKIFAMAVNCENPQNGNPCLVCNSCVGIANGSILDVIEMDAASNNGVDDVRILRDEANYTPTHCKYRVYIIDETHMLSTAAFNALLKIMEEPPAHVKFILATTEIHKVPVTIVSRCQRFDFVRINTEKIADRLLMVADNEEFTLTKEAAMIIAKIADGSMRDALSTLQLCASYASDITDEIVSAATGLVLKDYLFTATDFIVSNDSVKLLGLVNDIHNASKDLQRFCLELTEHFRNLMIVKTVQKPENLVRSLPEELTLLQEQSKKTSLSFLLNAIDILQQTTDKLSLNYDKRISIETAMIRLCTPSQDRTVEQLLSRIENLENIIKSGVIPKATEKKVEAKAPIEDLPKVQSIMQESVPTSAPIKAQEQASSKKVAPVLFDKWVEVMSKIKKTPIGGMLSGSMAYVAGDTLFIDSPNTFFTKVVNRENFTSHLKKALIEVTGQNYKLKMKVGSTTQNDEGDAKAEENAVNPLDAIAENAKKLDIDVTES